MPYLERNLTLERCPHCAVANPNLVMNKSIETKNHTGDNNRLWYIYVCASCGGVVTACSDIEKGSILQLFPEQKTVEESIPEKPRAFLEQAVASIHAPAGAVMLCASSIDAMLKIKGYNKGTLSVRIESSAEDHLITTDMAAWAHDIRLDANDQRHADEETELPNQDDAQRVIEFTRAFAEFLFVLPEKVRRGIESHRS